MKKLLRPLRSLLPTFPILLAVAGASAAVVPTEWRYRQSLQVRTPGLIRVPLPDETLAGAADRQQDLRVLDPQGREVALVVDTPVTAPARTTRALNFTTRLESTGMVLTFETGTDDPIESATLETPVPFFLRPARVEVSETGESWARVDDGVPLFRQWGAEQLRLQLGGRRVRAIRVTVDDRRTMSLPFTGATLQIAQGPTAETVEADAHIANREEFASETVLTLSPGAGPLAISALALETPEPAFTRRVTVGVREFDGTIARERLLGSGTVYRVALAGALPRSSLTLDLAQSVPAAELLVHIHNADSPPLEITAVRLQRPLVSVAFVASAPGTYSLLSGNPRAVAPRYDLAALAGDLRTANATRVVPGPREDLPDYRPRDPLATPTLAQVPLTGAPLDVSAWIRTKPVHITRGGVQELELDPYVLSGSRLDLADLRLMHAGNQVPYLLERPNLSRSLILDATPIPGSGPSLSRWRLTLPARRMPLQRLVISSPSTLFERDFRVFERAPSADGRTVERTLASGTWRRSPDGDSPGSFVFELKDRPATADLFLETNNGDNPAIDLGKVTGVYPVIWLVFKAEEDNDGYTLAYGRSAAAAPRYDLGLVANTMLSADRHAADLGLEKVHQPGAFSGLLSGAKGGVIFWVALGLVVVGLLVVVAGMLPKQPAR